MELIKTTKNDTGEIIVSGRELHEFLEVSSNYTTWFKRMCEYGFEGDVDFVEFWSDSKKGTVVEMTGSTQQMTANGFQIDHALKLDMAKEISMIQRNEKGKQARQYFIEVEKRYKVQQPDGLELALQAALQHTREIKEIKTDVDYLKGSMRIDSLQQQEIQSAANQSVTQALGGKESDAYATISKKVFSAFWNEFKKYFKVPRYGDIPKVKHDEALRFIQMWRPSTSLQMEIDGCNSQMKFE